MSGVAPDPLDRTEAWARSAKASYGSTMTDSEIKDVLALVEVARSLERLVADLETNSEYGAPDYAHEALRRLHVGRS